MNHAPASRTLASFGLALLLAACSSAVKLDETPVESRNPAPVSGATGTSTGQSGAASTGVAQSQVASVNVGPSAAAAAAAAATAAGRVVYFDFDSFAVRDDARPVVDAHARALAANKARKLMIEGHTDERGGREYNLALGQKRAEAVQKALTLLGAADTQIEAVSFGKERPASQGNDEAAWAKNRRAELKDRP